MQEIVDRLAQDDVEVAGARVALQVFDPEGHPSTEALRAMAGDLVELPVYYWALPDDRAPAEALVRAAIGGGLDAVTFTAQPAVHHLFRIAESLHVDDHLRAAFNGPLLASCVGAVCASAAREEGLTGAIWPDPPRLGAMVKQLMDRLSAGGAEL